MDTRRFADYLKWNTKEEKKPAKESEAEAALRQQEAFEKSKLLTLREQVYNLQEHYNNCFQREEKARAYSLLEKAKERLRAQEELLDNLKKQADAIKNKKPLAGSAKAFSNAKKQPSQDLEEGDIWNDQHDRLNGLQEYDGDGSDYQDKKKESKEPSELDKGDEWNDQHDRIDGLAEQEGGEGEEKAKESAVTETIKAEVRSRQWGNPEIFHDDKKTAEGRQEANVSKIKTGEQEKTERVIIADVTAIVDRYARTLAEKKIQENIQSTPWWNLLKKSWYRLAEAGYVEKYFQEAKTEILENRNLLSQIETRFMRKSEGVALHTGDDVIHYEILDKVLEAYEKDALVDREKEVKGEHIKDAEVDSKVSALFRDFATGRVKSREDFDREVEARVVPLLGHAGAKQGSDRMYASNLFGMAERYRQDTELKIEEIRREQGPEAAEAAKEFIYRTMNVDVMLGEKQADLYSKRPEGVMKWYQNFVDFTQNPLLSNSRVGRMAGRVLANPILYAAVGGLTARSAVRAAGVGLAVTAFGGGTAMLIGAGVGAGIYLGVRAARERRRDIQRREQEAALGLRKSETHDLVSAQDLIAELDRMKGGTLSVADKNKVADMQARLDLQSIYGVDLIAAEKLEGEMYKTKFMSETNLRIKLKEFLVDKKDELPLNEFDKLRGVAERSLGVQIEKVNKDVAREIRMRGLKVGALGGAMSMAAGAIAPWLAHEGARGTDEVFGTHLASDKTPWLTEAWHKAFGHAKSHDLAGLNEATIGHQAVRLPNGYNLDVHNTEHYAAIVDANGHSLPGTEHLQIGPDGRFTDQAIEQLKNQGWDIKQTAEIITPGSGKSLAESMHLSHHAVADSHDEAGKFFSTIHNKEIEFEGKQQMFYLDKTQGGEVQADLRGILQNLQDNINSLGQPGHEFGLNPDGSVDTHLAHLQEKLMEWQQAGTLHEHLKIYAVPNGEANANHMSALVGTADSKGVAQFDHNFSESLNSSGGALRDGQINCRFLQIRLEDDNGMGHVLATVKGHDMVGFNGDPQTLIQPATIELSHQVDNPWFLAGYWREKDKGLDKARDARKGEKPVKEEKALRKSTEAATAAAAVKEAKQEKEEEKKEGEKPETVQEAKKSAEKKVEAEEKKEKEPDIDPELAGTLERFNKSKDNKNPHIKLEFDRALKVPPQSKETKELVESLIEALKDPARGLRNNPEHEDKNLVLKFSKSGPYEPSTDKFGSLVLVLDPEAEMNALIPIIRRQLKRKEKREQKQDNEERQGKPRRKRSEDNE